MSERSARPASLVFAVIYQVVKAALLLLLFQTMSRPHSDPLPSSADTTSAVSTNPFLLFIPLVAIYLFVIAIGLWFTQRWARHALLPAAGLNFVYWSNIPLIDTFDLRLLRSTVPYWIVAIVVALDLLVVLILNLPDVARTFNGSDSGSG